VPRGPTVLAHHRHLPVGGSINPRRDVGIERHRVGSRRDRLPTTTTVERFHQETRYRPRSVPGNGVGDIAVCSIDRDLIDILGVKIGTAPGASAVGAAEYTSFRAAEKTKWAAAEVNDTTVSGDGHAVREKQWLRQLHRGPGGAEVRRAKQARRTDVEHDHPARIARRNGDSPWQKPGIRECDGAPGGATVGRPPQRSGGRAVESESGGHEENARVQRIDSEPVETTRQAHGRPRIVAGYERRPDCQSKDE